MYDNHGSRLMPTILHDEAKHNPQRTFAVVAKSDNLEEGFYQVTFEQVARAVNHPLRHTTLSYIGVPDLRYNILFYAAVQCPYKVFLPSPRNPTAVNVSLLEQTQCLRLVHSSEVGSVAKTLQAAVYGLQCEQLPSLDELLVATPAEYPYNLKYEDIYREPILILHFSGSTGQPKPVINTHGTLTTYDVRDWPSVPGRINHDGLSTLRFSQPDSRIYDVFPPFHIAGFMTKVMVPLYNLTAPIPGPPLRPPSGSLAAEMIRLHKPRGAVIPPSIVEQLYHEHGGADLFKQLDVLLYAGGPLPQVVGDEISKHTTLCQFYGSTEMLQPAGESMFELVVFADKDLERTSSLYHNYPDVREWRTKDLFKPHPSKPDLWKFHARRDDILVFSSGEKLNPIPMESSITAVLGVRGALVVGQGYSHAALLVELGQDVASSSDLPQDLWPAVEKANTLLPGHGRIAKSMIIITDASKPFVRAGKGTVVRRLTEELFAEEIQKVYGSASTEPLRVPIVLKPPFLESDIKELVRSILAHVSIDDQMKDEDNLYAHGMDSVRTVEAVGLLKSCLLQSKPEADLDWLSAEILYRNPTIKRLISLLFDFLENETTPRKRDRIAEMQAKVAEYTVDLPQTLESLVTKEHTSRFSVAVTGTTGYLGSRLLIELIRNPRISRLYCLNRSTRAQTIFENHIPGKSTKLAFLHVDLASSYLSLSNEDYTRLLQDCHIILHNAWRVDFNLALDSFEDNLQSVKHLIDLSAASALRSPQQSVPEDIVENLGATMDIGYAESKHVAEHVLHAASRVGIPATIIRMGQISPSSAPEEEGTWPDGDLVPIFLRTCKASGSLASDFVDTVDWVPVDQAAIVVSEIVGHEIDSGSCVRFYNVVHPRPLLWSAVMDTVRIWCGEGTKTVSLQQWLQRIRELDTRDPRTLDRFPALRMLRIFDIMASRGPTHEYAMKNLIATSKSMSYFPVVDAALIETWLQKLSL
ncbi:putative NRPS-like enzyme [Mollisia scopiformis]|uniref:Putative NRPS-like enzyme n=1 Tax=Mollisia scopiformis TaxID=149040 RepID=A0A194XA85_MOLSC|nr:putative NRPS-like enzyme [Mollisia scopiformis]KUJ17080.1 putative NRPS-like enzyme [Mollisia scopiformis]